MTIKEYMKQQLVNRGMFEEQADEVIKTIIEDSTNNENSIVKGMADRWNHQTDEYPSVMLNILFMSIKKFVLDWIIKIKPEAWFKPLFEEKGE